MKDSHPVSLL